MRFEWDSAKDQSNIAKHGISFRRASAIFDSFHLLLEDDRYDYGERRDIAIGMIEGVAVIVVVHTGRSNRIRIISARPANRKERKRYHEALRQRADR